MNLETREKMMQMIYRLERLLAYAIKHNEVSEATRIRREISRIVERF